MGVRVGGCDGRGGSEGSAHVSSERAPLQPAGGGGLQAAPPHLSAFLFCFVFFFYSLSGSRALSVLLGPDSRSLRSVKKNKNKVQESCEVLSLWFRMVTCSESLVVGYRSGKRKHAK